MAMAKRVFLFILTNILILVTMSITWSILTRYFGVPQGYYPYLIFFSLFLGFGGAFLSLLMSKWMAKTMMGVKIIDPNVSDPRLKNVVFKVHNYAKAAGLSVMPEVGYYDSAEVNAFATGPSRRNSLVAVSAGLMHRMNDDEVDGVLAHEVAHIANGDMVTMTLLQGVINAIVIFAARVLANVVANAISKDERPGFFIQFGLIIAFEILFSLLGAIVVNAFSRFREYRADHGGAKLAGRDKMIAALERLKSTVDLIDEEQQAVASLKISGRNKSALQMLFASHPPLDQRIQRLQRANIV